MLGVPATQGREPDGLVFSFGSCGHDTTAQADFPTVHWVPAEAGTSTYANRH